MGKTVDFGKLRRKCAEARGMVQRHQIALIKSMGGKPFVTIVSAIDFWGTRRLGALRRNFSDGQSQIDKAISVATRQKTNLSRSLENGQYESLMKLLTYIKDASNIIKASVDQEYAEICNLGDPLGSDMDYYGEMDLFYD